MTTGFRKLIRAGALTAALVALVAGRAPALINPTFTPAHLVKHSTLILELRVGAARDGKATATVQRVLKGRCDEKALALALTPPGFDEHGKTARKLLDTTDGVSACFFACQTDTEGGTAPAGSEEANKALLHVEGIWMAFQQTKDKGWEMVKLEDSLNTTWNGGTDMLLRATEYLLANPRADLPVKEGITWAASKQFATLDGPVRAAMPVDLAGDGRWTLYVACQGGDRLFRYDAKAAELVDVTSAAKLAARSRVATWGDLNGDGRIDLLSYDGQAMVVHTQAADGTFTAGKAQLTGTLADGCLALACIGLDAPGQVGVVIGTRSSPLLWIPGQAQARPIGGPFAGKDLGAGGICLVADFDSDGLPDILQLFERGSLLYRGKAPGRFEDARPCKPALGDGGAGRASALVGDFDADGLLDVFTLCPDGPSRLWSNRGKGDFADTLAMAGELAYKGAAGAAGGSAGDFNNDGWQDVMFFYAAEPPKLYFNRGFRNFGLANGLEATLRDTLPAAEEGQQAGCLADLSGDGVLDTVVVLKNGQAWVFYPESTDPPRTLRIALPLKAGVSGPLTLTAYRAGRCLGAWNMAAGTCEALIGLPEAGPVTLKWQLPSGKTQERNLSVTGKPVRVVLDPEKP